MIALWDAIDDLVRAPGRRARVLWRRLQCRRSGHRLLNVWGAMGQFPARSSYHLLYVYCDRCGDVIDDGPSDAAMREVWL